MVDVVLCVRAVHWSGQYWLGSAESGRIICQWSSECCVWQRQAADWRW